MKYIAFILFLGFTFFSEAQNKIDFSKFEKGTSVKASGNISVVGFYYRAHDNKYELKYKTDKSAKKIEENSPEYFLLSIISSTSTSVASGVKILDDIRLKQDETAIVYPVHRIIYTTNGEKRCILKYEVKRGEKSTLGTLVLAQKGEKYAISPMQETDKMWYYIISKMKQQAFYKITWRDEDVEMKPLREKVVNEYFQIDANKLYAELQNLNKTNPTRYKLYCDN